MAVEPYVIWFILGVSLSVIEIFTAGFFIIWFGIAAFVTAFATYFYHNLIFELAIFTLASITLLTLTKPLYGKMNEGPKTASNVEALIGKTGIITTDIDNTQGVGLVKVEGETWSARSLHGDPIQVNTRVRVEKVEGAKLIVSKQ